MPCLRSHRQTNSLNLPPPSAPSSHHLFRSMYLPPVTTYRTQKILLEPPSQHLLPETPNSGTSHAGAHGAGGSESGRTYTNAASPAAVTDPGSSPIVLEGVPLPKREGMEVATAGPLCRSSSVAEWERGNAAQSTAVKRESFSSASKAWLESEGEDVVQEEEEEEDNNASHNNVKDIHSSVSRLNKGSFGRGGGGGGGGGGGRKITGNAAATKWSSWAHLPSPPNQQRHHQQELVAPLASDPAIDANDRPLAGHYRGVSCPDIGESVDVPSLFHGIATHDELDDLTALARKHLLVGLFVVAENGGDVVPSSTCVHQMFGTRRFYDMLFAYSTFLVHVIGTHVGGGGYPRCPVRGSNRRSTLVFCLHLDTENKPKLVLVHAPTHASSFSGMQARGGDWQSSCQGAAAVSYVCCFKSNFALSPILSVNSK